MHVVVGDGLTAAEFSTTRHYQPGDTLIVIGPNVQELGRGIAYARAPADAPWRYAYLLNSPARSVDPDFAQWMSDEWELLEASMTGRTPDWLSAAKPFSSINEQASLNAPREFYGDFIHAATLAKLESLRRCGVQVQLIASTVESITSAIDNLIVTTSDAQQFIAQSVDVATGGPGNQRFEGDDDGCSFPALFGNEERIAEKLATGGDIVCIGTAAAMLDCLRFCQSVQHEKDIKFTALSPGGKILRALRPSLNFKPTQFELDGTFDTADELLALIKSKQAHALDRGDSLYETRVGMRELFQKRSLNELIPNLQEARKVPGPLFRHFEGGTRDSIDDFDRLMKTGNTQVLAGNVQRIEHRNRRASVVYKDAHEKIRAVNANVVVNCAGHGTDYRFDALTAHLLEHNWISICEQGSGLRVGENGQTTVAGVRYLGPAVTSIGDAVEPVPLYDASRLRRAVQRFNAYYPTASAGCV